MLRLRSAARVASPSIPGEERRERELATVVLAWLYVAGGTIGLATLALPHPEALEELPLLGLCGGAYASVAALMLLGPFGRAGLQVMLALGTVMITVALWVAEDVPDEYAFFYLWVAFYGAYFLSRAQALIQVALVSVAFGVASYLWEPTGMRAGNWVVVVGSLLVGAILVRLLKERMDELVGRLSRAAETDPLTGILNRRGFDDRLEVELKRARRLDHPVGLLLGDLDRFKEINDRFGHEAGDEALERVSAILQQDLRAGDSLARIGGEEFALILPATGPRGARIVAERMRRRLRSAFADHDVTLTISFGAAIFSEDGEDLESLLRAADRALYSAKAMGRDRLMSSEGEAAVEAGEPESGILRVYEGGREASD